MVNRAWAGDQSSAGARPDEARRHNRAALLRRLHVGGPCTRATLAGELGLILRKRGFHPMVKHRDLGK